MEKQLRERAIVPGVAAEDFVLDALAEPLGASSRQPVRMSEEASGPLEEINRGLPEATWRCAETLKEAALDLNHVRRLRIREAEAFFGLFPPREAS